MRKEMDEAVQAECSSQSPSNEVWGTLWKLLIPNVEKNFFVEGMS